MIEKLKKEVFAGVRDEKWIAYFLGYLLASVLVLTGIVFLATGTISDPASSVSMKMVLFIATLFSVVMAGLHDGPSGHLGAPVWIAVIIAVFTVGVFRAIRNVGQTVNIGFRFAGKGFVIELEPDASDAAYIGASRHRAVPFESVTTHSIKWV